MPRSPTPGICRLPQIRTPMVTAVNLPLMLMLRWGVWLYSSFFSLGARGKWMVSGWKLKEGRVLIHMSRSQLPKSIFRVASHGASSPATQANMAVKAIILRARNKCTRKV